MRFPRSILITGASSGIGSALAREYARPGVTLALGGRDIGRTTAIVNECRARGANATAGIFDVTEPAASHRFVVDSDRAASLDLVIANAGISAISGPGGETEEQARAIFATNVDGVMNIVFPAVAAMRTRAPRDGTRGQIAIMSSLAGFHGYPGAPAYVASKNAVRAWGESLRGELYHEGIRISVICPGFIETPMTAGATFPQPFKISAEKAARIIARGLARGRSRIAFPFPTYVAAWLGIALPERMVDPLIRRMPKKR